MVGGKGVRQRENQHWVGWWSGRPRVCWYFPFKSFYYLFIFISLLPTLFVDGSIVVLYFLYVASSIAEKFSTWPTHSTLREQTAEPANRTRNPALPLRRSHTSLAPLFSQPLTGPYIGTHISLPALFLPPRPCTGEFQCTSATIIPDTECENPVDKGHDRLDTRISYVKRCECVVRQPSANWWPIGSLITRASGVF